MILIINYFYYDCKKFEDSVVCLKYGVNNEIRKGDFTIISCDYFYVYIFCIYICKGNMILILFV